MGNTVGRPPKFKTAAEIQALIDEYFEGCKGEPLMVDGEPFVDKNGFPVMINTRPLTVTGLALALGFHSRQSLLNYQAKKEFMDTIIRAKMRVEEYCEARLFDRDGQRGAQFSLEHNFRWARDNKDDSDDGNAAGVVMIPEVGVPDG